MRLVLSRWVHGDLDSIASFIAAGSPDRAVSFIEEVTQHFSFIAAHPRLFRLRPEIGRDARLALVGRYAILFRLQANAVRIERVTYAGRDLASVLAERNP